MFFLPVSDAVINPETQLQPSEELVQAGKYLYKQFQENLGQFPCDDVLFYTQTHDGYVGFGIDQIIIWREGVEGPTLLELVTSTNIPQGFGVLSHLSNYFLGDRGAFTNIRAFTSVVYENLQPDMDLIFTRNLQGVEYTIESDLVEESLDLTDSLSQYFPAASSEEIHLGPLQNGPTVYSTYLGGSNYDMARSVAVDNNGNVYITGYTDSSNFPIMNAINSTRNGLEDCFILKMNADGGSLAYSTFIGGADIDQGEAIEVDTSGNVYVAGTTRSNDFPTTNTSHIGGGNSDCFIVKLNPSGNELLYSTEIGGTGQDTTGSMVIDSTGIIYVAGETNSENFPTVNAYNATYSGDGDCFVFKLDPETDILHYSTYLGGHDDENANSIAIDDSGNAYITGQTSSNDFPTVNAYNNTLGGFMDCFVTKFDSSGSFLVFSTLVGGNDGEVGSAIAVDATEAVYVAGSTSSLNFPTIGGYDTTPGEEDDCFVFKINPAGDSLVYSTLVGGDGYEYVSDLSIDSSGQVYVVGQTMSDNFPIANAWYDEYRTNEDGFMFELSAEGKYLIHSTYVGGQCHDECNSVAVDSSGNVYVTGGTDSIDFTTLNAYDDSYSNYMDCFLIKFESVENLDTSGPEFNILPITYPTDQDMAIAAFLNDTNIVHQAILSYSIDDGVTWSNLSMSHATESEGEWYVWMPRFELLTVVTFKIYAQDGVGNWAVSPEDSYVIEAYDAWGGFLTSMAWLGIFIILPCGGIFYFVGRRRGKKAVDAIPTEPTEPVSDVDIEVLRGCECIGAKFEYKVKIKNDSEFVLNRVTVSIASYPEDCMRLEGETSKRISMIEPDGFRSPQFTFIPTKDCVGGVIQATVSFIDHKNELGVVEVEPYTIRSVCDLLTPLEKTLEEFEDAIHDMTVAVEEITADSNAAILFSKTIALLPAMNFHIIESSSKSENGVFYGTVRGLARGKYTGSRVAVRIAITGALDAQVAQVQIEGLGDDEAMLPTTLQELTETITG